MDGGGIWKVKKGDGGGLGRSLSGRGRISLKVSLAKNLRAMYIVVKAPLALCHAVLALDANDERFNRPACTLGRGDYCVAIEICERRRVNRWQFFKHLGRRRRASGAWDRTPLSQRHHSGWSRRNPEDGLTRFSGSGNLQKGCLERGRPNK
jgi:hypothetical protein